MATKDGKSNSSYQQQAVDAAEGREGADRMLAGLPAAEESGEEQASGRKMDPELKIMGSMLRQLEELDEPAKARVVTWLSSRYKSEG